MKRARGGLGRAAVLAAAAYGIILAGNLAHDAALAAQDSVSASGSPVAVAKISSGLRGAYD